MEYTIVQISPGVWELRAADGTVVESFTGDDDEQLRDQALMRLSVELGGLRQLAVAAGTVTDEGGLLPETWEGDIAFSVDLPGGRDFTGCAWSWRDPDAVVVPLMDLTETSEWGHLGAQLAGFATEFSLSGGTVHARGRFYNIEAGVGLRDRMAAGPPIGVSVDPTENISTEFHEECTETDDDGFCVAADYSLVFTAYEIGALTACPVAGFENAAVTIVRAGRQVAIAPIRMHVFPDGLLTPASADTAAPVRAALSIPRRPPRSYFEVPEPQLGEEWLDGLMGDEVLAVQVDMEGNEVAHAVPLTIRDDGLIFASLTWWGQCHTGNPWGPGACASARPSRNGYADFLTGETICADGTRIATGVLTVGCEHSSEMSAGGVRDHLAHAGMGWADVTIRDGVYGPWLSGALRPDLTEQQVDLVRRLALSGEWAGELGGVLSVNQGGLPIQRANRLAASALGAGHAIPAAIRAAKSNGGELERLVGGNIVRTCPECQQRRLAARVQHGASSVSREEFARALGVLDKIERRTRHLAGEAGDRALATIVGDVDPQHVVAAVGKGAK